LTTLPLRPIESNETDASLEVNGMHALHRPHLPRAVMVTVIAAVLAIVLTLVLATRLNDVGSTPAPTAVAGASIVLQPPAPRDRWNLSPFAPLLSAPPLVPWAPAHP
jgi:hypothetical protein